MEKTKKKEDSPEQKAANLRQEALKEKQKGLEQNLQETKQDLKEAKRQTLERQQRREAEQAAQREAEKKKEKERPVESTGFMSIRRAAPPPGMSDARQMKLIEDTEINELVAQFIDKQELFPPDFEMEIASIFVIKENKVRVLNFLYGALCDPIPKMRSSAPSKKKGSS